LCYGSAGNVALKMLRPLDYDACKAVLKMWPRSGNRNKKSIAAESSRLVRNDAMKWHY
jgi:hypothetical protein